ncbi:MAG: hypothetical protein IKU59_03790 [Bacteroidales bacterium]|nr:hypothetical protein [Bacteroidales bacterium]
MKIKFILLVALFALLPLSVTAQFYKAKKVAITEVVDASGKVSEATKKLFRTTLIDAITNSESYEAYTQISFVSLELNFDKTGNIASSTFEYVKQQEMSYILVSKISPIGKNLLLLSAQIIETSTGKIVASSSVNTNTKSSSLRKASKQLSNKLLNSI